LHAAEQQRPDVQKSRKDWVRKSRRLDFRKLVFLDETGAKTNMTRLYGWGPKSERLKEPVPHGHWNTTTLVQAVDYQGCRAAMTTNGPMNSWIFDKFVDWILLPNLRSGDILVMDNLSSHKSVLTLLKIESKGVEIRFLPPYSPDLNPIEKIFSKVKAVLRSLAARTTRTLDKAISKAIASITPDDCINCFNACGYGLHRS
jgi:transposase